MLGKPVVASNAKRQRQHVIHHAALSNRRHSVITNVFLPHPLSPGPLVSGRSNRTEKFDCRRCREVRRAQLIVLIFCLIPLQRAAAGAASRCPCPASCRLLGVGHGGCTLVLLYFSLMFSLTLCPALFPTPLHPAYILCETASRSQRRWRAA